MSAQAPEGWYPDGHGNERYWDGSAWTSHLRPPVGANATTAANSSAKKEGAFSKLKKAAADKQAEKRSARDDLDRKQAEYARAAGALVTSGVFGTSTVEIYEGGYVRVAAGLRSDEQPARIAKKTPYEKLRSIKYTQPGQNDSSGMSSALEGAVGPAMARLAKGGAGLLKGGAGGLMKASAPGLAVAGLAHLAAAEGRKSFLTIVTDKEIHTLTNESSNGLVSTGNKGHNEVGLILEAAGNAVLGFVGVVAQEPVSELRPAAVSPGAAEPTLAEKLRELADLHKDGILSDEEFAAVKGRLLGGI
jgi:hypothetical protein